MDTFGQILNMTPHDVTLVTWDPEVGETSREVFPRIGGSEIRLKSLEQTRDEKLSKSLEGRQIWTPQTFVGIESWHEDKIEYEKVAAIIVSLPVSDYLRAHPSVLRNDPKKNHLVILNPDTGPNSGAIRDKGVIVAVKRLNGWSLGNLEFS